MRNVHESIMSLAQAFSNEPLAKAYSFVVVSNIIETYCPLDMTPSNVVYQAMIKKLVEFVSPTTSPSLYMVFTHVSALPGIYTANNIIDKITFPLKFNSSRPVLPPDALYSRKKYAVGGKAAEKAVRSLLSKARAIPPKALSR
ncbi:hypothetical protein Ae201684P_020320 [Aphanomyces euteiches]|nr:hypothetical protein Ae201684P_020320 [Aphanomyces euteiches]